MRFAKFINKQINKIVKFQCTQTLWILREKNKMQVIDVAFAVQVHQFYFIKTKCIFTTGRVLEDTF